MTVTLIQLTEEEFDARFPLLQNHLNPHASWGFGNDRGCLFETYGEEFEFVRQQDPATVWTIVDGDDGDWYVVDGLHFVNRVGYLISREPIPEGTMFEVHIPLSHDDDEEESEEP